MVDFNRLPPRLKYVLLIGAGQAAAFLAGLVVVRTSGRADYAAYSATMAAVGAVLTVADSGTGSILTARLAGSDRSLAARGRLLSGAFVIRRYTMVPVFCVLGAVLAFVLINLHQSVFLVAASIATLGVLASSTLYRSLLTADLEIERRFVPIAASDASANIVRLLLVSITAFAVTGGRVPLVLLLLFSLAASFTQTYVAGRASPFHPLSRNGMTDGTPMYRRAIRQTLPWTVLSIAGDQLVNILLALNDNAIAIAEIAALTRYALAFNLVNSLLGPVIVARVALVQTGRRSVIRSVLLVSSGGLALCSAFVGGIWLFRRGLLGLLGPSYSNLDAPFLVLAVASAFQFFNVYVLGSAIHARGWTRGNWIFGPCLIGWVAWALLLARPTTTLQASIVVLTLQIPAFISQIGRVIIGLRSMPRQPEN